MRKRSLFRKMPVLTLALGLVVGAFPGLSSAAGSTPFTAPGRSIDSLESSPFSLSSPSQQTFISPRINTKSNRSIRVIVQLEGQPAAVGKYAAKQGLRSLAEEASEASVNQEQQEVLAQAADQGLQLEVNYQYNTVLNGFEVTIPADQIPQLASIPGIKSIQENSTWYPVPIETSSMDIETPYEINPISQIGADEAWKKNLTGKGLKIGVIDTGIDYLHPDIAGAYKGGYDSFYKDNDPYEDAPEPEIGFAGTSHGTHVAGTIVGRAANTQSEIVQKGIAYEADLYAYKVLGKDEQRLDSATGSSAQVIDGIERAVKDGMDVINLSLGSDSEKDVNSPDAIAINNAVLSGVIAVIANGNAGPGYYSLGSPATSQLAISVGAVDSDSTHYTGSLSSALVSNTVTTATYATYGFNVMGWETRNDDFATVFGTVPQQVVYAGLGDAVDYKDKDVNGKIVLVSRGKLAFVEKIAHAKANGAKAILIFNGRANGAEADLSSSIPSSFDGHIGVSLGDSFAFIPALDLKGTDGRILAKAILENPDLELSITFDSKFDQETVTGDRLASFTSWGPNADPGLSIKPDIVAPGVNVISSVPAYGKFDSGSSYEKAYERSSGTSMAAPHIAGLALLLKQQHPDWGPFEVRSALANTAEVLVDEANDLYDVYQQGAGRAYVANAIETPALLQAVEPITILDKNYNQKHVTNYNSSANFGITPAGAALSKTLQLKNVSRQEVSYSAEVEWHGPHPGVTAALNKDTVNAKVGKASSFQLDLEVAAGAKSGFYEGQVNLSSPNVPNLHLPFVVYVGDEQPENGFGIQEMKLTNVIVYPNRNKQQSTDLSFKLTAEDTNYIEIDVVNLEDETIGLLGYRNTKSAADRFEPGVYTFEGIGNKYHPYDDSNKLILDEHGVPVTRHLVDGTYKIAVYAAQLTEDGTIAIDNYGNEIVYSAYTSYRVDNSKNPGNGGGNGSGNGNGNGNSGGGGSTNVTPPGNSGNPADTSGAAANAVIGQGYKSISLVAKSTTAEGVTSATVSDSDLQAALNSIPANSPAAIVITLPPDSGSTATQVGLTAKQTKLLAGSNAKNTFVISTGESALSLPVSMLAKAPEAAGLQLSITKGTKDHIAAFTAKLRGGTLIGTPVAFSADWITSAGSKPIQIPSDIFVKRAFTVPGSIEPNTAGVLYHDNGQVKPVASVFKAQDNGSTLVTVSHPGFSVYAAASRKVNFNDISTSPVASHIQALANKFIIEGTSDSTFSPQNNLTRAEFTSLLVRALGLQSSAPVSFTDIKGSEWFAEDIGAALEAGLIQGTGQGKFSPNAQVTRQELAVILSRALKLTGTELKIANPSFEAYTDLAGIAVFAKESVQSLSAAGLIGGIAAEGGSFFKPTAPTNRETAASALHLLLIKAGLTD